MSAAVVVALAVLGTSYVASSAALLVLGRARATGVLGALTGAALWTPLVLDLTGRPVTTRDLVWLAAHLGLLALAVYPRVRRQVEDVVGVALVVLAPLVVLGATAAWSASPRWTGAAGSSAMTMLGALFLLVWWRLEHPAHHDRWPLAWLALSLGAALVVAGTAVFAASSDASHVVAVLAFAPVGPALCAGVRRVDLIDVRGLVVRFAVTATTVIAFVAALASLAAVVTLVSGDPPAIGLLALLGAGCALGFAPLQRVLRGVVDELLFGRRPDPLGAASQVAGHLGEDPRAALDAVRASLVLPYLSLVVDTVEVAASGASVAYVRSLPLPMAPRSTGELRVGLRPGDLDLTRDDRRVLGLVAPLLVQVLRARSLVEEVQASRQGTVAALAEERRRVRRDLHDGLGPRLSGIAFTTDAARNLLRSDPPAADALLADVRAATVAAIREVREIAYGLRPPALDELGLVPAVRQQTATLRTPDGTAFLVRVEAADLPPLPAALEVAAFRIAVEALTNAARHSGAGSAEACLHVADNQLVVEVVDRGSTTGPWPTGVGTASMRERAAELGGSVMQVPSAAGGRVRAVLPLGPAAG